MTVVNYLTKTELPTTAFNTGNFDASSQAAVINQLIVDGLYDPINPDSGKSIWVESDIYNGAAQPPLFGSGGSSTVPGFVQALEVEGSNVTVQTDSTLKIIVDDGNGPNNMLTVTGTSNPVFIALGNSNTTVSLTDTGNDTVLGGAGNDSITANTGHDLLIAGGGSNVLTDLLSGGSDTLVAGPGADTINGVQGDTFLLSSGPSGGNDVYNIYNGSGNSTINLGSGADSVNFFTTAGNDTISNGGNAVDTVSYTGSSTNLLTDIKSITPGTGAQSGDYLIKFTDGQSVDMIGHGVSATKIAFTLEFNDGTLNLKGGS
jgi:Ca2+-binding RTX toxin-like protein